ncbi:1,4-beta-D-glucan glucohydrolase [Thalassotalea insulae]|uniref:1,4-beta-D-glucan glucohydrolase n=1 Tax=Thalassotalea insulae TaxID=2056778 RepID=A0ABQ6GT58_9GAMM|nr:glycoside hydrolase family 3 N-terminal domain-containing protein [Thalassotalea insulae]GLX77837.1 1,4-beta-D-glucan glucohydrolase [Thalassotalea insulae]
MLSTQQLKFSRTTCLTLAFLSVLIGCHSQQSKKVENKVAEHRFQPDITIWPELDFAVKKSPVVEQKVAALLSTMTIEQKVAQMMQPEIKDITVEDMRKYGFGSYLNGGGSFPNNDKHATPQDWIALAEAMYQASVDDSLDGSSIPTMWGTDAVHGHNNVIGATLFPHNIGLGAMNNPELIEKIAQVTAREVMVTGIDWVFAPTVAVVRDDRWGRTYEGYSEDPEIVGKYSAAIVKGLQGAADKDFLSDQRVISTVKHFIGDGGTEGGDDQGNNLASEQELLDIHGQGYVSGLTVGAQSVMASFNSWHGKKNHGNKYLLTDVLKDRMGFDGFVVGDWNGHGQIKGCSNESCPQAANAGLDVYMVPTGAWKPLYENTVAQVKGGVIPMARIDDAVSRILRVKVRAGLFDKSSPANRPLSGKTALIGSEPHREVARQAVRESLVLLKNNNHLLPLSRHQNILVAGDAADNIGKQSGGWTITWQGTGNSNTDFPGGSSIYDGIKAKLANGDGSLQFDVDGNFKQKPDVAIVVFGEEPYAEGNGDIDNLEYQRGNKKDLALLKRLKAQGIPVVSVFISGRPMWVNAELNASDAFVAAWLPGSEGAAISDVLFQKANGEIDYDFTGRLSFTWPATAEQTSVNRFDQDYQPLLPYGYGLDYSQDSQLSDELNEKSEQRLEKLSSLKIFNRAVQKPWLAFLQSANEATQINSNVQKMGAISYKAIDKNVQEDARAVVFDGSEPAAIYFSASFPEDIRSYVELKSALSINLKIEQKPSDKVSLVMACESECQADVDVTNQLETMELNQWQTVTVDLACFTKNGLDAAKVYSPFKLMTAGTLSLSFADIALVPNSASNADIRCQ